MWPYETTSLEVQCLSITPEVRIFKYFKIVRLQAPNEWWAHLHSIQICSVSKQLRSIDKKAKITESLIPYILKNDYYCKCFLCR